MLQHPSDRGPDLGVHGIKLIKIQQRGLGDAPAKKLQAVLGGAQTVDLAMSAVCLGVALVVAIEPVQLQLKQARALAGASGLSEIEKRIIDREEIRAIGNLTGHPEP